MNGKPAADQLGNDLGLEIGKGQDEVGLQCEDFVYVRRCEGAHARFLAASLRRRTT